MKIINIQYGDKNLEFTIPEQNIIGRIEGKSEKENITEEEAILKALENPIENPGIRNIVKKGNLICIVISDITRSWQRIHIYLPYIIKELNDIGIEDEDITLLSANGTHRKQTEEEHKLLIGEELYKRFKIIDHDCFDEENMKYIGTTSFGTHVNINKIAAESDVLIVTGAITYHDMAGFGGGRKSILPGISSYKTIMENHALTLSPVVGEGSNKLTVSGKLSGNPMNEDMIEAALMMAPDFMFNVIINGSEKIGHAVAGDVVKAHARGCAIVENSEEVLIDEQADIVITSAGGYPKDINLYQGSKALTNARWAAKEGGVIILVCECREGFGSEEVEFIISNFENNMQREMELRRDYTIAKYTGFLITEIAEKYNIILVSSLKSKLLKDAGISCVDSMEDALQLAMKKDKNATIYIMPHGANTLPVLNKK